MSTTIGRYTAMAERGELKQETPKKAPAKPKPTQKPATKE